MQLSVTDPWNTSIISIGNKRKLCSMDMQIPKSSGFALRLGLFRI